MRLAVQTHESRVARCQAQQQFLSLSANKFDASSVVFLVAVNHIIYFMRL